MKTVISLPNTIFFEAEEVAQNLGVSRNALYQKALTEYLKKINRKNIIKKLNEVYNRDYYKEFKPMSNIGLECIRELTKNDIW